MNYHLRHMITILARRCREIGIAPGLALVLGIVLFAGACWLAFSRTVYAPWILSGFALGYLLRLSTGQRNDFILSVADTKTYRQIRMAENGLLVSPFAVAFLVFGAWWFAPGIIVLGLLLSFIRFKKSSSFTIPTPFGSRPWEFAAGFRRTLPFLGIIYFIAVMGWVVGNFNLGMFALGLTFLASMYFHYETEPEFPVWIQAFTAKEFLMRKSLTAILYSSVLGLPIAISYLFLPGGTLWVIPLIFIIGWIYVLCVLYGKYTDFPSKMGMAPELLIGFGMWFPPAMLVLMIYFYFKSIKRLRLTLG